MTKLRLLMLSAAAFGLLSAAPASATEIFDLIDQPTLDAFHTEAFGVITDELGDFTHAFTFTTADFASASSSLITISMGGGADDIDFSGIDLDGLAFEQHVFDPDAETWDLNVASLLPGLHTITVHGAVVSGPASYTGTLNIGAIPEPATWAMMILGFSGVGAVVRRRRAMAAA